MRINHIPVIILLLIFGCQSSLLAQEKKYLKTDTIHIVGHAHMDMNWEWTYFETMKMCNDNLRQVVAFMDEFPDFTMIQSQAAVYNFVEKVDPPLFQLLKNYVKSGRLELGGGMWTEGDMNLSSGEAITRTFLLGQRYFQNHFGRMANVGWLPDNFGHVSQMPQILRLSGCDYFFFSRCRPYQGTFWWQGTDSSRVLCYAGPYGQRLISPGSLMDVYKLTESKHRCLHPTGIGDHGGGPTREMIEIVHELDKKPDFPAVKFTTAGDFFQKASKEMDDRPTHYGEMQYTFEGCYTTVAEIKEGNRNLENALYACEFFNTLRWLNGDTYPADELHDIWTTLTFNQFHDILPGSAIYESNRQSIARYTEELRKTTELRDNAFRRMADEIKFQTGMGQPIVAYNLHPYEHRTIVEAEVYSHNEPVTIKMDGAGHYYGSNINPTDIGQGTVPTVLVSDGSGKIYPAQLIWEKFTPPGYTSTVQFVVDNIPSCGYKTFYVDVSKPGEFNEPIPFNNNTFETDYFKIMFDMCTGAIVSLFDKRTGKEYVRTGGQLNKLRIYLEDKNGNMKAWNINKITGEEDVTNVESVKVVENGPVRACVETIKVWGKSRFIERTYIYRFYPRITYDMEVHWLETGTDSTDSPMLRAIFPIAIDNARFDCNVPFDILSRPVDGQEVPAQKWVDITDGNTGIALLNKTKYGHSYTDGELRLTLMRSAGEPDIYPNLGKFNISYALYPHSGDWKNGVWAEGDDFNIPVYAAEPPSLALLKAHATHPEEASFFSVDAPGVILTGMKQAEDGDELIIRLNEVFGKETTVILELPNEVSAVRRLNLIELPLENAAKPFIIGKSIQFRIKPYEILTFGITHTI